MHKILKFILLIYFYASAISLNAQNKYAVLLAVNNYYENPGVISPHSLHGCINDANAIKGLLLNRFGFAPGNIATLYDAKVTKKNFIDLMHIMLQKCKPGDALVFYYSGHGVWMNNHYNDSNVVKRGMSQAIVTSDLYANNWDCLVKDETLKEVFNQFVLKKVIVTTIFDCCYSGNVMMLPHEDEYWQPMPFHTMEKAMFLSDIPYYPVSEKPAGCRIDSLGKIIDTLDTDKDGVPDCKDWQINSLPHGPVDSDGIVIDSMTEDKFLAQQDNYFDSAKFVSNAAVINNELDSVGVDTRSFDLKQALTMSFRSNAPRPSEIKNSGFLSIAATTDKNKGLEISDDAGMKHGAFTIALLKIYKKNSPNLRVVDLLKDITAELQYQKNNQGPTYNYDAGRLNGNLLGIKSDDFPKNIKAICTKNASGIITLDKGMYAGVATGNIFTDESVPSKPTIQIVKANNESATAIDKTHGLIKQGHILSLIDNYTTSAPLVKIFIPSATFTPAGFNDFFRNKVTEWVNLPNYGDYNFQFNKAGSTMIFCDDANNYHKSTITQDGMKDGPILLYIFLPVPSYIGDAFKSTLMKDQNIEIVNDQNKADYVLYLNYSKDRPGKKHAYVFYFHPPLFKNDTQAIFSKDNLSVPSLDVSANFLQTLSSKIHELAVKTIRYSSTTWMNEDAKR